MKEKNAQKLFRIKIKIKPLIEAIDEIIEDDFIMYYIGRKTEDEKPKKLDQALNYLNKARKHIESVLRLDSLEEKSKDI